ncbi:MAG: glycosyltransferase family 1 protein [Pirellulales bacterium]
MNVGVMLTEVAPQAGGGFTFERELLAALLGVGSESRHRFTLFAPPGGLPDLPRGGHFEIVTLPAARRTVERLRSSAWKVIRVLTKSGRRERRRAQKVGWRERLLLASDVDLMWYLAPGAATMEIPYITVVWDLQHRLQPFFPEVSGEAQWDLRERQYAAVLRRAAIVIAGTQAGKAEIERFYQVPPERIRILPHPTPQFAFWPPTGDDEQVLARLGLRPGYIVYPAQFWPHKNHVGLLRALRILRDERGVALDAVFLGADKGNRPYVERIAAELGLSARLHLPGFVTQEELVVLYRNALALGYVSYFGPENLPPLEAFAAGCPVVAADVPGSDEQLADAALRVDPRDERQIADAIYRIHSDPALRASLVARGRERAHRFRPEDFVRGVLAIVDELEPIRDCWAPGPGYREL